VDILNFSISRESIFGRQNSRLQVPGGLILDHLSAADVPNELSPSIGIIIHEKLVPTPAGNLANDLRRSYVCSAHRSPRDRDQRDAIHCSRMISIFFNPTLLIHTRSNSCIAVSLQAFRVPPLTA
jgi:hypothetical protein